MSIYEALMLICFGASWPFAVLKTYRTKNVKGKSLVFLSLIIIGYICGIIHKCIYKLDAVLLLYIVNLVLVSADMVLCVKYRNNDKFIEEM